MNRRSSDRGFARSLGRLALPIAAQHLVTSSLNLVDVVMIGRLGATAVASVGLANQLWFLLSFLLFGITSGGGAFAAQLWGRRDRTGLQRVLGIGLAVGAAASLPFAAAAVLLPRTVVALYSPDAAVVSAGAAYLRLVGWSYPLAAVTFSFAAVLSSTGQVRLPTLVSASALALNTLLNWLLIFGHAGLPRLGVRGAALATLIARGLECLALLALTYGRHEAAAAAWRGLFGFDRSFLRRVLAVSVPVMLNEGLWALGMSAYQAVYARIGTEAAAAVNITATIEGLAFVLFIGIGSAGGILIGQRIGAGRQEEAFRAAGRILLLGAAGAVLVGLLMLAGRDPVLALYDLSESVRSQARGILAVLSVVLWIKVSNLILFVGVLRSGGDTLFSFLADCGSIWLIGVPLAFFGAFVLRLPVQLVVLLVVTEEAVKLAVALGRWRSRRWIRSLPGGSS